MERKFTFKKPSSSNSTTSTTASTASSSAPASTDVPKYPMFGQKRFEPVKVVNKLTNKPNPVAAEQPAPASKIGNLLSKQTLKTNNLENVNPNSQASLLPYFSLNSKKPKENGTAGKFKESAKRRSSLFKKRSENDEEEASHESEDVSKYLPKEEEDKSVVTVSTENSSSVPVTAVLSRESPTSSNARICPLMTLSGVASAIMERL